MVRETYCRPSGAWPVRWCWRTHGLRRGLPAVVRSRSAVAKRHGFHNAVGYLNAVAPTM